MTDIWPAWKRSEVMSRIRGRGNLSTEIKLRTILIAANLRGWRRHLRLPERPDFAFPKVKVAIFADGDFWHGRFARRPQVNRDYWLNKIEGNRLRDRKYNRKLRSMGWSVVRLWESDLKTKPEYCLARIMRALRKKNYKPSK